MKGAIYMAKITTKQIQQINNACSNGWQLDTQYFLFHNEKTLIKCIELDEEHYLQFSLNYNYKKQISLHISKFYHKQGESYASTNGLGKSKVLVETPAKRKTINDLILLTGGLDNIKLMKINEDTPVSNGGGLFLQSEEF